MRMTLKLVALFGLALASCLDFPTAYEVCRDAGRCGEAQAATGGGRSTDGGDAAGGAGGGNDGGGSATGGGSGGANPDSRASATDSLILVDPARVPADGTSAATATVTVRNGLGQPLLGQLVRLTYAGAASITPAEEISNDAGAATFRLTASQATSGAVGAIVNPGPDQVLLTSPSPVHFFAAHALGGHLQYLSGNGLVLSTPDVPPISVPAGAERFSFPGVPVGTAYSVTVKAQPSGQRCTVDGGSGTMSDADVTSVEVSCVSTWLRVAAGGSHVVGLKTDGTVWAWGRNTTGQVGDGTIEERARPARVAGDAFVFVAAGFAHSMAIAADGGLWAWGDHHAGQLGLGPLDPDAGQTFVPSPAQVTHSAAAGTSSVALGGLHSLFVRLDGQLAVTGSNLTGQLGAASSFSRTRPWPIGAYSAAAAGTLHSLAVAPDGGWYGWGLNADGQTGAGSDAGGQLFAPLPVPGAYVQVAAGGYHSLGLKSDGSLWGWGSNQWAVLGDVHDAGARFVPVLLGTGYSRVAAGSFHTLALKADGTLWAWGSCESGQLGDGCDGGVKGPTFVGGDFTAMAGGDSHSVGIKRDGTLWAWGSNAEGQLGIGVDGGLFPLPVLVR